tara:strand:+ start:1241 stop:2353 length:1113 start_codon:yes stop_codon:yes gene_type:complete
LEEKLRKASKRISQSLGKIYKLINKKKLQNFLEQIKNISKELNKKTAFSIGNTVKKETDIYYTPIRITEQVVVGGVIISNEKEAKEICKLIDGKVNYIFVDSEKKIPNLGRKILSNIERIARDIIKKTKIYSYKANDLTVEAIDTLLCKLYENDKRNLGGKKISIVGCGNIGFKVALKLVERGANVYINRRNTKLLKTFSNTINLVKNKYTHAKVRYTSNNLSISKNADILIGLSQGTVCIYENMVNLMKENSIIVDVGKGTISAKAIELAKKKNVNLLRLDVSIAFKAMIYNNLLSENIFDKNYGRKKIKEVTIISGGIYGYKNEIVVDSIYNPKIIYGISNGRGELKKNISKKEELIIANLKKNNFEK